MTRWNGSLIGVQKNTSLTDSTGVWNLRRQTLAKQNAVWPLDNSAIPQPTWSLDFSSGSPWADDINYSFSSTISNGRTVVNENGFITNSISNNCFYSENFSTWTRDGLQAFGSGSITDTAIAPNGTTTADLITETNTNGPHGMYSNGNSLSFAPNVRHSISIYAKQSSSNTRDHISVGFEVGGVGGALVIFSLITGETVSNLGFGGSLVLVSTNSENVGNGWWRLNLIFYHTGSTTGSGSIRIGPAIVSASNYYGIPSYQGDGIKGILVWGAQQTQSYSLLPYIKTITGSISIPRLTHDRNGARLGLLIEGSVTNGLPYSNDLSTTWQLSGVTRSLNQNSPANDTTALRLVEQAGSTGHVIYTDVTRTNVVFSAYLKKDQRTAASMKFWLAGNNWCNCTFNLDAGTAGSIVTSTTNSFTNTGSGIENAGNNWYRCWIRATVPTNSSVQHSISLNTTPTPTLRTDNGSQDYEGNTANGIFIWGAQSEEANRNPSSYIPTVASAVTRNEDRVHITKSKITNWSSPGAICVHFYKPLQAGTLVSTDDASAEQLGIQAATTSTARAFWSSGQTATGDIGEPVVQKAVHYWDGTTSKFCINGTTVQTGTNNVTVFNNTNFITLGAEATDSSGSPGTFSNYANCVIRKVEFYSGSLTDTNLQEITQGDAAYQIEYLVVAGGGAGGSAGGGGGAGGFRTASGFNLTVGTSYTITVGAGGTGGAGRGGSGNDSVFSIITSTGGGGGGGPFPNKTGLNGGSGGGGSRAAGEKGLGTSGQGNDGGQGATGTDGASGGGGAGAVGGNGTGTWPNETPGNGGNGSTFYGTTYAGGGGGGRLLGTGDSVGGTGGGGAGRYNVDGIAGSVNTGGGGGGSGDKNGGNGGSGVVILRMPTINYSGIHTGTPSVSQVENDTVLVFNASGTYTA